MKKKIALFFIVFIYLLACSKISGQSGNAKSLAIGNRWIYFVNDLLFQHYEYFEVIGDTVFNDAIYAVIKNTIDGSSWERHIYERADSIKLFRYSTQSGYETILVDFNLNVGDTLNDYIVTSKDYVFIWGETLIEMSLFLDDPGLIWYDDHYTEKIGLIWEEADGPAINGHTYDLKGAIIEGKIYGDSTLLNIEKTELLLLNKFILHPNYPNPFNPITKIRYDILNTGNIELKVYDILGSEVATLVNETKPPGRYEVEFNASDLTSGIYIYRIETPDFTQSQKMVLIR